jgi:valyl-tRNA synthetase
MPFISEEMYHILRERAAGDDLIVRQLAPLVVPDIAVLKGGLMLQEVITAVRDTRNKNLLKPKDKIKLWIDSADKAFYASVEGILARQVNAEQIGYTTEAKQGCIALVVQTDKMYIEANAAAIDTTVQKQQMEKDIVYYTGFIASLDKKLDNEKFVQNAKPEVIENERKKRADAVAKIKTLQESLSLL